jgi:hypothetical protein
MSAVRELIEALVAGGMDTVDAAEMVARAGAELSIPKKSTNAERQKRYRERNKTVTNVTRNVTNVTRNESVTNRNESVTNVTNPENALLLTSLTTSESEDKKGRKKVRARKAPAGPIPPEFQPNEKHFEAADRLGIPRQAVFEKSEDMRIWAQSSGAVKADWDATLHGFLRRDAAKLSTNGGTNGPHQPKPGSIPAIAKRHAEYFESQPGDSFEGYSSPVFRLPRR